MAALAVFRLPLDRPDARPAQVAPAAADLDSALLWVDIRLAAPPQQLGDELSHLSLPGLDEALIDALRRGDTTGTEHHAVDTADLDARQQAGAPVSLSVRRLWLIAGAGWVLTARQPAALSGPGKPEELTREDLLHRIERRWHPWRSAAADDLATLLLLELVSTGPAALERAQLEGGVAEVGERTIAAAALQAELALLRRQIIAVDRGVRRLARPGRDPVSAWFRAHGTEHEALQVAAVLDACRSELAALLEAQRSTLQLIAGQAAVDQLRLADAAAQRGQALQQLVAWLTGVLLIPTLVATVLGALPAIFEHCPVARALVVGGATLATMSAGALAAWILVGPPSIRPAERAPCC